jgi:orotidine 5'-phosphate decarboxylase subfamily 1
MSSKGCLATDEYAQETLKMAVRHSDFVFGFIGQRRLPLPEGVETDFLYMTPGVQLQSKGDALGQQYRTPHQVLVDSGCDIIIVGRGIYGSGDMVENAKMYQKAGWEAYLARLSA